MIKLHLGCGKRYLGPDWVHIDGNNYAHVRHYDIINPPYDDSTVDMIYRSHVLQYFDRRQGLKVLSGWYDLLKPEGCLRLAVPDFSAMAELYVDGKFPLDSFLGPLYGKMQMGDEMIYHKTVYDFKSLRSLLFDAGFRNVRSWDWRKADHGHVDDHSQRYLPHMDKCNGKLISLNMEAIK